jgi:hypothetical protein
MWLGVNQYNPDDICSICHENYGTSQAIYKTPCNHVFHNNCLNQYCEMYEGNIVCPICRSDLGDSCMDVWAFKEMAAIRKESMTEALTNAILMYIDVEEEKTQE